MVKIQFFKLKEVSEKQSIKLPLRKMSDTEGKDSE